MPNRKQSLSGILKVFCFTEHKWVGHCTLMSCFHTCRYMSLSTVSSLVRDSQLFLRTGMLCDFSEGSWSPNNVSWKLWTCFCRSTAKAVHAMPRSYLPSNWTDNELPVHFKRNPTIKSYSFWATWRFPHPRQIPLSKFMLTLLVQLSLSWLLFFMHMCTLHLRVYFLH